jgi:type III restriction enzyme
MKIQFDPELDFQREAIDSVVAIFDGQESCRTNFTVSHPVQVADQEVIPGLDSELGVGNRLRLLDEDILQNVREIQLRNGLAPAHELTGLDFTVEMETGTGKTYVYLRTALELNRQYGFTKFIVVVPSVAIKEGVYKSLEITEEHFKGLYENVPIDYFVYDSQKLGQVRNFAASDSVQIMVINIDAFRKSFTDPTALSKANIIHRPHDRMSGNRPIDFIRQTHPIVIIDEPQSVDTTERSREAIASLNPLCTLRYSATHVDKHQMMYKLGAVDAYERKLVKQIEVAELGVSDHHNQAYVKLISVNNRAGGIAARVKLDEQRANGGVARTTKAVRAGNDLFELSGGRALYEGYIVEDIARDADEGRWYLSFTSRADIAWEGVAIGTVDDDQFKRMQIRKTIEHHLDKELYLTPKGIKVLSLFFIDRVGNYREYDEDGVPQMGKYAVWFEEEYATAVRKPKYKTLFGEIDTEVDAALVHDGYFAVDRQKDATGEGRLKDSRGEGKTQADESAYNLIMREKERLLSFETPLRFLFSHSALREGWDNPNVFQICTLNESGSRIRKRQEIGRGLRIAVNQDGERVHGFDVNTLTVMANESYEDFVKALQEEIEEEEGIRFGVVEPHLFARIPIQDGTEVRPLGEKASTEIVEHLREAGYVDRRGKVQDSLRVAIKAGAIDLPEAYEPHSPLILASLRNVAGSLHIKNASERTQVRLNKAVYLSPEFKALWDQVKHKTTFRVDFDAEELVRKCAGEVSKHVIVSKARFTYRRAITSIDRGGVGAELIGESTYIYGAEHFEIPDILSYLQNETQLTRRSLCRILIDSGRLDQFKNNPQRFIERVLGIIRKQMQLFIVDGIKYHRIGDDVYYGQELFEDQELFGYLSKNMLESNKSPFEHVVYDFGVEHAFAQAMERSDDVQVYAKLPAWFKIDTPLGSYNPDWAVLIDTDDGRRLYFVVETKSTLFTEALRATEKAKIDCGIEHFRALGTEGEFRVADSFEELRGSV